VSAHRFSKSAADKISQAGGEAIVLPGKAPVVKQKPARKKNKKQPAASE
jgi:ribosomal protein L18E